MKKCICFILTLVLFMLPLSVVCSAEGETYSFSVYLCDIGNAENPVFIEGLKGTNLELSIIDENFLVHTYCGTLFPVPFAERGYISFSDIPAGEYTVRLKLDDYEFRDEGPVKLKIPEDLEDQKVTLYLKKIKPDTPDVDFSGDGVVGAEDFQYIVNAALSDEYNAVYDLDGDGVCDVLDCVIAERIISRAN